VGFAHVNSPKKTNPHFPTLRPDCAVNFPRKHGPPGPFHPDTQFTADDIIVFLNRFFAGC